MSVESAPHPLAVFEGIRVPKADRDLERGGLKVVFADWCGHCRRMAPVLRQVQDHFDRLGFAPTYVQCFNLGKHSAYTEDERRRIADAFNVDAYPTIAFTTRLGQVVEFDGGKRTLEAIVDFAERNDVTRPSLPA